MSKIISVIIPVYNVEKYIEECVDSVLNQTFTDFELILVDDGSTDNSPGILDRYAQEDERVTVIHKENQGVSAARNDGLDKAVGEYLYIMDSDDYLEKDTLQILYDLAVETGADMVMGDHYTFTEDGRHTPHHFFSKEFVTTDPDIISAVQKMVLHKSFSPYMVEGDSALGIAPPWTRLVKASLVKDHSLRFDPYVKGIFDDGLFALEELEFTKCLAYTSKFIYRYRLLSSSLIHKFNPKRRAINHRIIKRLNQFQQKYHKDTDFQNAVDCRIIMNYVNLLDTCYMNEQYKASVYKKIALMQAVAKSEDYCSAFGNVDLNCLTATQKMVTRLVRRNCCFLIPALFKARELLRKH